MLKNKDGREHDSKAPKSVQEPPCSGVARNMPGSASESLNDRKRPAVPIIAPRVFAVKSWFQGWVGFMFSQEKSEPLKNSHFEGCC